MSDEQAMEIIENLSEELGEKELKIMALEKALEEEKKEKMEYYDLCQFQKFKIDYAGVNEDEGWSPVEIVGEQFYGGKEPDEIVIKAILHYFGGRILTKEEHIEECDDFAIDYWEQYVDDNFCDIVYLHNGNYWISDEF